MNTLIIYGSKTGTVRKCARMISEQLKNSKMIDISEQFEDIGKYDLIVVGTPIRMGMIDKRIKNFLLKNIEILQTKRVAYFICCAFNENWQIYYEQNIPNVLLNKAMIYESFGGEMDIEKQTGFDKFIVKIVSKKMGESKEIKLLDDNIDKFIKKLLTD